MAIDLGLLEQAATKLVTLGISMTEHIHDCTTTQPGTDLAEGSKAFERVSRGTRLSILLACKLAEPLRRVAARKQIIRAVEDTIQRRAEDDDEAETLEVELLDRLDTLDLEDELGSRPVQDIITDILRDFGLAHVPGTHPLEAPHPRRRRGTPRPCRRPAPGRSQRAQAGFTPGAVARRNRPHPGNAAQSRRSPTHRVGASAPG